MACSAPLCSECFFTSLESSEWIVCARGDKTNGGGGFQFSHQILSGDSKLRQTAAPPQPVTGFLINGSVRMTMPLHQQTQVTTESAWKALKSRSQGFPKNERDLPFFKDHGGRVNRINTGQNLSAVRGCLTRKSLACITVLTFRSACMPTQFQDMGSVIAPARSQKLSHFAAPKAPE